jgi:DNA-binding MarR family transcriptional regulator
MKPDELNKLRGFANAVQRLTRQIVKNNDACDKLCSACFGVTSTEGDAILRLPDKGTLSMDKLSKAMNLANSTMTRKAGQLIDKGLIYRASDPKDRRLVRVGLTRTGQGLRRDLKKALENFYRGALDEIQEEERGLIIRGLERLNAAIAKGARSCSEIGASPTSRLRRKAVAKK